MDNTSISPEKIRQQSILFYVLDWGLGHATRSSLLITQLLKQQNQIIIVSSGAAAAYLKNKFPNLVLEALPDLNMHYYRNWPAWVSVVLQFHKIHRRIKLEKAHVADLVNKQSFDIVISDSCYGAYHASLPSVMISHQLHLKTKYFNYFLNYFYKKYWLPFNMIWVPDYATNDNLSGDLAHDNAVKRIKPSLLYIQPLCRFEALPVLEKTITYLFVLSGPEPMRSVFEAEAVQFCWDKKASTVIVRGSENRLAKNDNASPAFIKYYDVLADNELSLLLASSKVLICRSGYSSIMDYSLLPITKYILATPGQTEQIYLAKHLDQRFGFKRIIKLTEINDEELPSS